MNESIAHPPHISPTITYPTIASSEMILLIDNGTYTHSKSHFIDQKDKFLNSLSKKLTLTLLVINTLIEC